jgi:hypothetical protein
MKRWLGMLGVSLAITFGASAAENVYQAPSPEPTNDETLILELMNRFRADPTNEVERWKGGNPWNNIDEKMFLKEMKELTPAPPLVFNLKLLDAARKHSHYMVLNGLGHDEDPSKAGFTGKNPGERAKLAGYQSGGWGENAFRDPGSAYKSHVGFIVDAGAGPGNMQPGRGHRTNMMGKGYREIGPGAVPHGGGSNVSVTHLFGAGSGVRFCGGVVFLDKNNNHFYDPGEGIGEVKIIASDGTSVSTWNSGSYTLLLKSAGPVTIMTEYAGERKTQQFAAGKENIKFDLEISPEVHYKKADVLISAVTAAEKDEAKLFVAKVNLLEDAKALYLDAERQKKIKELTEGLPADIETHKQAVIAALKEFKDVQTFTSVLNEQRKPFRGTRLEAWFTQAESAAKAAQLVISYGQKVASAKLTGLKAPDVATTKATIDEMKKTVLSTDLQGVLDELKNKIG